MNQNRMTTPIFPGAMTPADLTRRALTAAAAFVTMAAFIAIMTTIFIMCN